MRRILCVAAMLAVGMTPAGADGGRTILYLDVSCRGLEADDAIADVDINLSDALSVAGRSDEIRPEWVSVMEVGLDRALAEAISQFDPASDYDPKGNARGTLLWQVKGKLSPTQARRFAVVLDPNRNAPSAPGISVSDSPEAIVVENAGYRVVHPKKENGGLIKEITFKGSGQCDRDIEFNDRVHDKTTQRGYFLRNDKNPAVRIAHQGPLRAVIEVQAKYVHADGKPAESGAAAAYRFSYLAGSPSVGIEANVEQQTAFNWSELHCIEIYHKTPFFPKWALGPGDAVGEFTKTIDPAKEKERKKSFDGSNWGALFGNGNALGLAVGGRLIVYDGLGDYGAYLHGPWVANWSDTAWQAQATLYLGPDAGAPDALRQWAEGIVSGPLVKVEIPRASSDIRRAKGKAKSPIARWRLARAAADIQAGRDILRAASTVREVAKAAGGFQFFAPKVETYETDDQVFVSNGQIGLGFSRSEMGTALTSLYDFKHEKDFIPSGRAGKLWRIALKNKAGETVTLTSADTFTSPDIKITSPPFGDSRTVEITWEAVSLPEGNGVVFVTAKATVEPDSPLTLWRIDVRNGSREFGLWEVEFPIVSNLDGRSEGAAQEFVAYPEGWGVLLPNPRASFRFGPMYPSGSCAMQFAAYYAGGSGVYYAAHDGDAYTKRINLTGADPTAGITFSWIHYPPDMLKPGAPFNQAYDAVVGVFDGDWYDAARVYRAWALKQVWCSCGPLSARKDIPNRFKELAMWGRTRANPEDARVDNEQFKKRFPVPIANHWYCWHVIPFDNDYPEYFPAKPGFKEAVAAAHQLPVWQMPYINGRLWDTDTESFAKVGKPYSSKNEKMEPYIEEYGSKQKLAPMCPYTPCWQDKVNEIVWKLIDEYKLAGVYIDQVGAAAPTLCMDPSHGHPLGGGKWWVEGYWKMLSEMKKRMKAKYPDAFLTTESNAEPYMQYFDGYLMCNSTRHNLIPLFSAVYHDYNLTFGRYVFAGDLKIENAYYMKMGQLFAFGAQLAWIPNDILAEQCKEGADYLAHLAKLRARSLKYLAFGEFLRPLTFTNDIPVAKTEWKVFRQPHPVEFPAIQSSVWRAPDGSVGLVFTNVLKDPISATYSFDAAAYGLPPAKSYAISEITEDGEKEIARADSATFSRTEKIDGHRGLVLSVKPGR